MSRPAFQTPVADRSEGLSRDALDLALDRAAMRARQLTGGCAIAGILVSGRPGRVSLDPGLEPSAVAPAWRLAATAPDGLIRSPVDGSAGAWTGYRYRLDDDRVACLLVAQADLDEATAAGAEAAALDIVRVALV